MCILKWNPSNMSGNLSNLGYGWGPLTSGMHITVNPPSQQYFTCYWKGCYHMRNGYAQAPLLFTKLLKQPFGFLRKHGYASVVYIDDSYLQGDTYAQCLENIHATHNLLVSLGFSINRDKSVLQPAPCIILLGFVLDSLSMSICLSDTRKGVILVTHTKFILWSLQSVVVLQLSLGSNMVVYSTATWKGVKNLALKSATLSKP